MSPLLSIIVPVYKVEKYLSTCVESILKQPFSDFELILIDDGSPDNCGNICEEYAQQDKRIRVIHQHNGGLSAARNSGISIAKGKYITFIDSDDEIHVDTYAINMDILLMDESIDLLEFPVYIKYDSPNQYIRKMEKEHVYGTKEIFIDWIKRKGYLHAYSWNKIYRKELFKSINFPLGKTFEDTYTTPLILQKVKHIYYSDAGLYYYYYRSNSITKNASYNEHCDLFNANMKILHDVSLIPELKKEGFIIYLHTIDVLIDIFRVIKRKEMIVEFPLEEIIKYKMFLFDLLKLDISLYRKLKNISLCIFGVKIHTELFSWMDNSCNKI